MVSKNLTHGKLIIANNFISSLDNDYECIMHSKSDNIEVMINDEADKIIQEPFDWLKLDIKIT